MRHGDILNPDTRSGAKARAATRRREERREKAVKRFFRDPDGTLKTMMALNQKLTHEVGELRTLNREYKRLLVERGHRFVEPAATGASMYDVDAEEA